MANGQNQNTKWIIIGLFVVAILFGGGYLKAPTEGTTTGEAVTTTTTTTTTPTTTGLQSYQTITSTTLSLAPEDNFVPGAVVDVEGIVQRNSATILDSGSLLTATVSVNPGETLSIAMFDDGQTTGVDGNTSVVLDGTNDWYGWINRNYVVPIAPTASVSVKMYKEGALTAWANNPDGTVNASGTQWDMAVGETDSIEITLKGPSKASFGDPYAVDTGITAVADYNSSWINSVRFKNPDGTDATSVGLPLTYISRKYAARFNFSALPDLTKKVVTLTVKIQSGIGQNDLANDINIAFLDTSLYFDATDGHGFKYDIEDTEDGTAIGRANVDQNIYIN